jgi:hypothetical protein
MKLSASKLFLGFLLLVLIVVSMTGSVTKINEAFSTSASWKMNGQFSTLSPYSSENKPDPSLFMFSDNKISPECCKSATYSSSTGCVCTTPEQRNFINQRGGNRTVEDGF